jgi:hypothetical protein
VDKVSEPFMFFHVDKFCFAVFIHMRIILIAQPPGRDQRLGKDMLLSARGIGRLVRPKMGRRSSGIKANGMRMVVRRESENPEEEKRSAWGTHV